MSSEFDHIENRLQALIENSLNRLPWRNARPKLATALAIAMREQMVLAIQASEPLPDRFNIFMAPENCDAWESHADWQEWLANAILAMAGEFNRGFAREPEVRFIPDKELDRKRVRVVLSYQEVEVSSTAVLLPEADPLLALPISGTTNPFLILNGHDTFPITAAVINIGRRETNDLVLTDPRISREHAQIRVIHGECILFDLNSTGGTFVNGQRITSHHLQPGDVIMLAGTSLIYGEDAPKTPPSSGTAPAKLGNVNGATS